MSDVYFSMIAKWITPVFLLAYIYFLTDFREPFKKSQRLWCLLVCIAVGVNLALQAAAPFCRLCESVRMLPLLLLCLCATFFLSAHRNLRSIFTVFTVVFLGCVIDTCATGAAELSGKGWIDLVMRLLLFIGGIWGLRWYREPYMNMIRKVDQGWKLVVLIPAGFCTVYYLLQGSRESFSPALYWMLLGSIAALGSCIYYILYLFFKEVLGEKEARQNQEMLAMQVRHFEMQVKDYEDAEWQVAVLRHDLKHYTYVISGLLAQGQRKQALEAICDAKKKFENAADFAQVRQRGEE